MNDTELKELWRRQAPMAPVDVSSDADVIDRMNARLRKFDRELFWRDVGEVAACGVIAIWFGWYLLVLPSTLTRIGCIIVMLSAAMITAVLLVARRSDRAPVGSVSVSESLRAELCKVARQEKLLTNVLWWYLLPIFGGAELFVLGLNLPAVNKWVMTGTFVFTGVVVYWANRYVAKRKLRPLIAEIERTLSTIASLDNDPQ